MKPEKVKSRWRRNSEMETEESNSVIPLDNNPTCIFDNKDISMMSKSSLKFENLEENLYLFERKKTKRKKEVRRMLCECSVTNDNEVACGEECLNRLLMIECGSRCATGDACSNRRFQKRQYVKTEPFLTEKKGYGLKVIEDVPRGAFIIEYVGEVLDAMLFKQRVKQYAQEKESSSHYYFMALKSDEIIDARNKGNLSRFINHSCDPNCETQKWTVCGDLRIGFFAKRDIKKNEELTFDYQLQRYGRHAQKCFCESENCQGFIGVSDEITVDIDTHISPKERARTKNTAKKCDKDEKRKEVLEEVMFEEEMEKLCVSGLRNKEHTLILARLMLRSEDAATREKLLDIILGTTEIACLRLFLDCHGLTILMCWMADVSDDNLKAKILEALSILPVPNKNLLIDSKVFSLVEKWAYPNSEKEKKRDFCGSGDSSLSCENAYSKDKKIKSCDTSDSETDGTTPVDISMSSKSDSIFSDCDGMIKNTNPAVFLSDEDSPDNSKTQSAEIESLAKNLLFSWKDLKKEDFRIPRRVDKKEDLNCNKLTNKSSERVEITKVNTQLMKGGNADERSSFSLNDEKPQEIKVVCPNFPRKYPHSVSRFLSKEEKRSLFAVKMQHRRKNVQKKPNVSYFNSHNIDYQAMDSESYQYPTAGREKNLHYIYQPPPLLQTPGTSPSAPHICTVPPPKCAEPTVPPIYAPNNVCPLYQPPNQTNFKMPPPPTFLGVPPPTIAPEHVTTIYGANNSLPPPSHMINLGVNSPIVPMQVSVCAPSDPGYMKTQHAPSNGEYPVLYISPPHTFPSSQQPEQQTYPLVRENGQLTQTKSVPLKLPPNWKTATDSDGNVYFYHTIKRESRWDPPTPEVLDNSTPTYDEPKTDPPHKHEKTHSLSRRSHQKPHSKRKSTTTAPADTSSSKVVNNEIAKKIRELFRSKMSTFVVQCLNPYRKDDCRVAKITSNEDFKHLARKLTHFIMAKELKHCKYVEDLDANDSVKFKTRDYIHKYMAKYGPVYRKDKCDPVREE